MSPNTRALPHDRPGLTLRGLALGLVVFISSNVAGAATLPLARNASGLPQALMRAELALVDASPDAAALFEHASHIKGESATAEIGMVRAYMSGGQYRRALSFAHLVRGERTHSTEALAWAALLMDRSGQTSIALQTLTEARGASPDDVALLCAQSEIRIDRQQAASAVSELDAWLLRNAANTPVLALRHRAAVSMRDPISEKIWARLIRPMSQRVLTDLAARDAETRGTWITPHFGALPATLTTVTGITIDDGLHVITSLRAMDTSHNPGTRILVRDAQGHVRSAVVASVLEDTDIALLKLDQPLPHKGDKVLEIAGRIFPGSSYQTIGFPVQNSTYPAFPVSTSGFFGRVMGALEQPLSQDHPLADGMAGAPVFNASGQLAGIVSRDPHAGTMQLAAPLLKRLGVSIKSAASGARLSSEEIYESALNRVVLVAITRPEH